MGRGPELLLPRRSCRGSLGLESRLVQELTVRDYVSDSHPPERFWPAPKVLHP
ncbi:MAG: hypothetical protein ACFCD0_20095 [Gemmataceae bacterium]